MGLLDKIRAKAGPETAPAPEALVKDPVCGMTIKPSGAAGKTVHAGQTIYFCAASCQRRFEADPAKYVGKA